MFRTKTLLETRKATRCNTHLIKIKKIFRFVYILFIKMISPRNVELQPWYGQ